MARFQTKDGEYPSGGDPYHDEHGRLASAPGGGGANIGQPAGNIPHMRVAKRDARLPTDAMSYDDLRSTIAKNNNRSKLPDDLIIAIAWRESGFDPSLTNPETQAKGLLGITHWATDDLRRIGENYNDKNLYDPATNIRVGTAYLAMRLRAKHVALSTMLDHYGTGPGYGASVLRAAAAIKANRADPIGALVRTIGKR